MITAAINALTSNLQSLGRLQTDSLIRLSSGVRSGGGLSPAALISAEELRSAMAAIDAGLRNADRTYAVAATADGALGEVSSLLNRANALVVANANEAGFTDAERDANSAEIAAIFNSIDRIAATTRFAGTPLLDGETTIQMGSSQLALPSVRTSDLGSIEIDGQSYTLRDVASGTVEGADAASVMQAAIGQVATARGQIGSFQSNLIESSRNSMTVGFESLSLSLSEISDTDYAMELAELARLDVMAKATLSALGLALSTSSMVLSLFDDDA